MRWIFRIFMVVAGLSVLSVFAIAFIPGKKLADMAAAQIAALSGREVTLSGDVTTKIFPHLSVTTGPITIANANWAEAEPMLTAEGLSVGVELIPLLKGSIEFRDVEILAPKIRFEVAEDGRKNWDFSRNPTGSLAGSLAESPTASTDVQPVQNPQDVSIDRVIVSDGELHYFDQSTRQRQTLSKVDVDARLPDVEGEIRVSLSALYNDALLDIEAGLDRPMAFLLGEIATLDATAKLEGTRVSYTGKLGLSGLVMDGDLMASIPNPARLTEQLGVGKSTFKQALSVQGKLVRTADGSTYVRGGVFGVGDQDFRGDIDVQGGKERPLVKGVFSAQDLNFAAFQSQKSQRQSSVTTAADGWPKALIDVSGLFAADADIALSAASLDLGAIQLGESQILMTLNAGRAVFDLRKVRAYGGDLVGEFVVNGRGGLSVGGDLSMQGIRTEQLLGALVGFERLESSADVKLKFLGVGTSMDAIMKSLSGQGAVSVKKGVLKGVDVTQMIRNLDLGFQGTDHRTVFDTIDATFTAEGGVLSGDDLVLKADGLTAAGRGEVDLVQKTIDYRLTPTIVVARDGKDGIRVPLILRGPWAKLQFSLDLQAIVDQELSEEKAALAQKLQAARETAKADAAKKLGVTQKDGESLEDAARRTIEENAAKELLKLLGNN